MKTLPSADQALTNQSKPGSEKEPSNIQRRTLIGGALVALLSSPGRVMAQGKAEEHRREDHSVPKDPFVLLLNGLYHPVPVGSGPDLGLHRAGVNLNDGTYSVTQIYPVHVEGIPCNANEDTAIGKFYVQFAGSPGNPQVTCESISNEYLPKKLKMPPEAIEQLKGFGFLLGAGEFENFSRTYEITTEKQAKEVAKLAMRILQEVYGLPKSAEVQIEVSLE